ncbi:hypothetical protein B7494_g1631 [Chlorociboria aeruginascens]|nr:hypothetical protein B7494_g1631 [Chlorociboria aeruginascens]
MSCSLHAFSLTKTGSQSEFIMAIGVVIPNLDKRPLGSGHSSSHSGSSSSGVSSRPFSVRKQETLPHANDDRGIEREVSDVHSIHSLLGTPCRNGGSNQEHEQECISSHQSLKDSSSTETTRSRSPPSNNTLSERDDEHRENANEDRVQLQIWTYETRNEAITVAEKLVKRTFEQEDSKED